MRALRWTLGLVLVAGHVLVARPADACSCPGPFNYPLYPKSGAMPANGALAIQANLSELRIVDATTTVVPYEVIATYEFPYCRNPTALVRPLQSLELGATYRVMQWLEGYQPGVLAEFTAAAPVLPDVQAVVDVQIAPREPGVHHWPPCGQVDVTREAIVTVTPSSTERLFVIATATAAARHSVSGELGTFPHEPVVHLPVDPVLEPLRLDVPNGATNFCVRAGAYDAVGTLVGSFDECIELPEDDADASTNAPADGGIDAGPTLDGGARTGSNAGSGGDDGGCRAAPRRPRHGVEWLALALIAGAIARRRAVRLRV